MLCFDRLNSTEVINGEVVFRVVSIDDKAVEFSVTPQVAVLMYSAIQLAAKSLPENPSYHPIIPQGIQPVIGPDLEPGISFLLGGGLAINLSLPYMELQALKAAIQKLEAHTSPGASRH